MTSVNDTKISGENEGNDNNKLVQQLVPEVLLKRRHDMDEMKARRAAQAFANPRGNRKIAASTKNALVKVHRPEKFVIEGRRRRNTDIRYQRVLRKGMQKRASDRVQVQQKTVKGSTDAGGEEITKTYASNSIGAKVVFAVRIRNNNAVPRNVQRVMKHLRLKHLYNGVFLKYNDSTRKMLHLVEPFVVYGILSKVGISIFFHCFFHPF
jgi:ribosomal protein L30/L7E